MSSVQEESPIRTRKRQKEKVMGFPNPGVRFGFTGEPPSVVAEMGEGLPSVACAQGELRSPSWRRLEKGSDPARSPVLPTFSLLPLVFVLTLSGSTRPGNL